MDEQTIKFWTAVSAYETAPPGGQPWTSHVFQDSMNPFNLEVPGTIRLPYGEGQTIYSSLSSAVQALVDHVIKPFRYPLSFPTISALVSFMKGKEYFEQSEDLYLAGVRSWYQKLFNQYHS